MFDLFLLLTPILLLGIVALLGFVGCGFQPTAAEDISISPASGPLAGGTSVTISGSNTNFSGAPTVNFGNRQTLTVTATAPSATLVSSTQLTATTPPSTSAGNVDVWVVYTYQSGTDATGAATFTYYAPVSLATESALDNAGAKTIQTTLNFSGQKLVVVTLLWGGTTLAANPVTAPGATFTQLYATTGPGLNPQQLAVFFASNVTGPITITANLTTNSSVDFIIAASAYDNAADPDTASVQKTTLPFVASPTLSFPGANLAPGDLIYAVVVGRNTASALSGKLVPGSGLTSEGTNITGFLAEDFSVPSTPPPSVTISASDSTGTATRWFTFAMRIPHA